MAEKIESRNKIEGNVQMEASPSIDPDQVTVDDIKRFEALMKGKAVCAISNANSVGGRV